MKFLTRLSYSCLLLVVSSYALASPPQTGSADNASSPGGPTLITRQSIHHDVSQPLRDLARNAALSPTPQEPKEAEEVKVIPLLGRFKPANEPDPVLQNALPSAGHTTTQATFAPTAGLNFEGLGSGFPNYIINVAPPDTNGAVGLTQYVQWVNLSFAVFDKGTGKVLLGPVAGNTLWAGFGGGCETQNDGDPIVTYDKLADRWVFSQFVIRNGPFLQCVAVSTTSDATGTYFRYSFEYSNFDDYPKMGVWPDAYYETFNMFGAGFIGADACAYDRKSMLSGQPATQICFQQAATVGGLLPADLDGHITPPAGSPNYMIDFDVNSLNLYKFHVDFANPGNSTFTGPINIPVAAFTPFCPSVHGCVPQPGGDGTRLDSLGDRLMYRLAYRNFGDHESLVVNHSVVADPLAQNSGVRWYEIQNPNGTPAVVQQSTFAPDGSFRWMGSVAMDASGNLALGYSVTNAATALFPSINIATRGAFDPLSTLNSETTIVTGTGSQIGGLTRWGDYSAMQVDPADDCTFWYTTEYLQNSGSFNWNTRITNFKFPGCGAPALSLAKSHTGNFTQGQTGATYSIVVTNIGSKPTDGTAITVTDTLPAGLSATAISSTDSLWMCTLGTLSCTRSDVLNPGKSYTAITVTVNVAANAPGFVTNQATVSGGGSKDTTDNSGSDITTVIQTGPDPAIAMTNVPLVQGQSAIYTITVTNRGLTTTTSAPLTVTEAPPAGLTATAIASSDPTWVCTLATLSCTRSDPLASNQSYPPIVVSVNISAPALTTVTNTASVSGGGDVNPLNNTANDSAIVVATAPGLAFSNPAIPQVPSVAVELKPGAVIAIAGTATGASFKDFTLQFAKGLNASTGFSSAGITLAGNGATPVTNGPLGTWDTSGITQADYYTLRLTVDDVGFSNFAQTFVYLEPSLISQHWPIALQAAPEFYSGFQSLADASGNQRLFLVIPGTLSGISGQYLSFSPDGASQTSVNVGAPSQLNPAAGPLDGSPDAVIPNRSSTAIAQVELVHSDNSSAVIPLPNSGGIFATFTFDRQAPVLEDMEGTGQLDFVSLAAFVPTETDQAFLVALRRDGSFLSPKFPVVIPDQNLNLLLTFKPRVLVGDLNGDGSREFVVIAGTSSSTFTLLQFGHDGTPIPWAVPQFNGTPAAMVLADLDHNGALETILTVAQPASFEDSLTMHVFQPDGSERPGFPVSLGFVNPDDFTFSQLMVGDLNRDGVEEIIETHHNGAVIVLEPDGTPFAGFSQFIPSPANSNGSMALADIDGDGFPEILLSEYQIPTFSASGVSSSTGGRATVQATLSPDGTVATSVTASTLQSQSGVPYFTEFLQAIRRDGTVARTWTLPGVNGNQPAPLTPAITVGDFNNDGITDIAVNDQTILGPDLGDPIGGGVAVVFTTGTPFHPAVNDWPLVYQNPRNTAVQRRSVTIALTFPFAGAHLSGTVPVTAGAAGSVASVQFKLDGANLGAAVTASPFTISWDTTKATVGTHILAAVATDQNGQPVASAPITVSVASGLTPSAVSLALTGGSNPARFGDSLTYQATITPNTATGTVIFADGIRPISGNVAVSNGVATFSTSSLASGTHSLTAEYSGDASFSASVSSAFTQNILGFVNVAVSPPSATIKAGSSATFTFTVTPVGGFNQTVNFSCSGLPALSQCTFVPPSVTPNGSPVTSVLTITTTAPSTSSATPIQFPSRPETPLPLYTYIFAVTLGLAGLALSLRWRLSAKPVRMWLAITVLFALAALMSCGGGSNNPPPPPPPHGGTPTGTSQITVTVSSGTSNQTAIITLTVQ